jgi:hypothetical protein
LAVVIETAACGKVLGVKELAEAAGVSREQV